MVNPSWLLKLQTKTSLLTVTTILISLSISASTANNIYLAPFKNIAETNLEYEFSNGSLSKKFTSTTHLANKATGFNQFSLQNNIFVFNSLDSLDTKKMLWQKGKNIDFQLVFKDKTFTDTISNQKFSAVEVARARFDKVQSGFTSRGGNSLNFDELPVNRRSQPSQKLQANTNQIINRVFPSFLCRSAFYAHEKSCNHIISLSPVIDENSKSDLLTNLETGNIPNLVNTPIFSVIEKNLNIPEVIGFVPDKFEIANSKPSKAVAGYPEVADRTEFNRDNQFQVSDSASKPVSNTIAGSTEIVDSNPTKVPEPITISLFSFGLIGMVISRYRHPHC
jgi:hypothetical protein